MHSIYVLSLSQNINPTQLWNTRAVKMMIVTIGPLFMPMTCPYFNFCNLSDCCNRHLF